MRLSPLLALVLLASFASAQTPIFIHRGAEDGDFAGEAAREVGDLDGDGVRDLLFSETGFDGAAGPDCGRVTALSAATQSILWQVEGSIAFGYLGGHFAPLGDVNSDGVPDWVAGTSYSGAGGPGSGAVWVGDGATGAILRTHVGAPDGNGDGFGDNLGFSVAGLDDANGDGVADYAFGAIGDYLEPSGCLAVDQRGRFELRSGADGSLLWSVQGGSGCLNAGYACAGIPDVNNDGLADLVVGYPESNFTPGRVEVLSGADGSTLRYHLGPTNGMFFGVAVAALGDMNGDGVEDYGGGALGIAAPVGPGAGGFVRAFSGIDGSVLRDFAAPEPMRGPGFGRGLARFDDETGDGVPELLVGATGVANDRMGIGRVYVIDGTSGAVLRSEDGEVGDQFHAFAARMTSVADLDGDQLREIVTGTWDNNRFGVSRGRVTISGSQRRAHYAGQNTVSLGAPSPIEFFVEGVAGAPYAVVGSFGGSSPATAIGPVVLPLVDDAWFRMTIDPAQTPFAQGFGLLDGNGRAVAQAFVPVGLPPSLAGVVHTTAAVVVAPGLVVRVSDPVRVTFLP